MNKNFIRNHFFAFLVLSMPGLLSVFNSCTTNNEQRFETESWSITIDSKGKILELSDSDKHNFLLADKESYILSLKVDSAILRPVRAGFSQEDNLITLAFENDVEIKVEVKQQEKHIRFEVVSVSNEDGINAAIWGPYYTRLNKSIGEVVGIAQGEEFTMGLLALNQKTLGGYSWADDDFLPQMDIFSQSDSENMEKEEGTPYTLYSVEAAKPIHNGSSLQAYTRNRNHDRVIENWGHKKYLAPAYNDGGLVGSKIALFGCATKNTLNTIGGIEITEGLPHPTINGEWVNMAKL